MTPRTAKDRLPALLLVALVIAALPAAAARADDEDRFGANIQSLIRQPVAQPAGWATYLTSMAADGLTVARFDAPWAWAEPAAPRAGIHAYDWQRLDEVAAVLARAHVRWLPVLDFLPPWVRVGAQRFPTTAYPDFAAYAAAFMRRYGAAGEFWRAHPELPALGVREVEVWNEANSINFWDPLQDAVVYLRAFRWVRAAIRSVDPSARALASFGWEDLDRYLDTFYRAGAKGQTDGIAFHPYAPTARGVLTLVAHLRRIMVAHREPDLPIDVTEIGWPRAPSGPGALHAWDGAVSDAARAATMALTADALLRSDCGVRSFIVYSLVEPELNPDHVEDWLGLYGRDNTPTAASRALGATIARWTAAPAGAAGPLRLCAPADDPPVAAAGAATPPPPPATGAGLLPLELEPSRSSPDCAAGRVGYHGNPIEDVSLVVRVLGAGTRGAASDATGRGEVCDPTAAGAAGAVLTWAALPGIARSPTYWCEGAGCRPLPCTAATLVAHRIARVVRGQARLGVRLRCGERALPGEALQVMTVDRRGRRRPFTSLWSGVNSARLAVPVLRRRHRALVVAFAGDADLGLPPAELGVRLRFGPRRPAAPR